MLAKNLVGIIILVLNIAGLGYVLYTVGLGLIGRFSNEETQGEEINTPTPVKKKTGMVIIDDSILPEEDDLLKDMDLSDLDNLNLDDFE